MLAASIGQHNVMRIVTVWRPSVCSIDILTVTHQGAVCHNVDGLSGRGLMASEYGQKGDELKRRKSKRRHT